MQSVSTGPTGPVQKSDLQSLVAAAQVSQNTKTITDTVSNITKTVLAYATNGVSKYVWEARHLNMEVILYDDGIIANICTAVQTAYPDSKVTSSKTISTKNASWTDYTITVDWS